MKQFIENMGNLQTEAYNEAIDDIVNTIIILSKQQEQNTIITLNELIEEIKLLKIN